MRSNQDYISELENLIVLDLLPVYTKYYSLLGEIPPDLNLSFEFKLRQRVPRLFQPKKLQIG